MEKRKALFLDRDGTVIEWVDYLHDPGLVKLRSCTVELLRIALQKNYLLIIVTNQSGVERKMFTMKEVNAVNQRMSDLLKAEGIVLTDIYVATYFEGAHPTDDSSKFQEFVAPNFATQKVGISKFNNSSYFRKPQTGMLLKAAKDHQLDLSLSVMIGDNESDERTGFNARLFKSHLIDKINDFDPKKIEL